MSKINEDYLGIVNNNLFAVRTLCDIDERIYGWEFNENGATIFIDVGLNSNERPEKACRGIRRFYNYIFGKEFGENSINVDCEYDLNNRLFELSIYEKKRGHD
jgi:hypothetical protein